jgi:chorismate lyase/3-hydroxybenzoate synthase
MSLPAPNLNDADALGGFPRPPAWVFERASLGTKPRLALFQAHQSGAVDLAADALTDVTADLYNHIREQAASAGTPHPLRFWNFIPRILEPMDETMNRYMVFNSGRHRALRNWFSAPSTFEASLPTATGVGHPGDGLHIYCLAGRERGTATENGRQRPAYRYSRRYGPQPPCFARATLIDDDATKTLLIGGTASVRGEDSVHLSNIEHQIEETFINLAGLMEDASRSCGSSGAGWQIEELRTYFVRPEDERLIRTKVDERFPGRRSTEMISAKLCRPELLVEIEGVAVAL